jgi:mRNA interferase YafQ
MALQLRKTSAFLRDLRRVNKRGYDLNKLNAVVALLQSETPVAAKYRDHALKGAWEGHRDCHVEPDWILLYRITAEGLVLVRTGTHSDLFDL